MTLHLGGTLGQGIFFLFIIFFLKTTFFNVLAHGVYSKNFPSGTGVPLLQKSWDIGLSGADIFSYQSIAIYYFHQHSSNLAIIELNQGKHSEHLQIIRGRWQEIIVPFIQDSPFYFVATHSQCFVKVKFPSVMEFFLLCFKQVLQNIFPPCSLRQACFVCQSAIFPTQGLAFGFFDLSLPDSLHSCRSFSNSLSLFVSSRIFVGSSACPSSTLFKEAVELLIILNRNLLCFNFVAMLKA